MGTKQKIYFNVFISIILIGIMYIGVLPKIANSLVALQNSHQDQITKLNQLNDQARSLNKMNEDLASLNKMQVQPQNFFTSDATLVNEIKTLEDAATTSGVVLTLSISGTADKAQAVPSASGLSQAPYNVSLVGSFPNVVKFVSYMQNRYFVTPIAGLNIVGATDNSTNVNATILANFYIYKPQVDAANVSKPPAPKATNSKP